MSSPQKNSVTWRRLGDFFLILLIISLLFPLFYLISNVQPNLISIIIYFLIMFPTLAALIRGAPFVPTPIDAVEAMVNAADLKDGQKIYDIGCGDGRIVYLASKAKNLKAVGLELSPFVYLLARIRKLFWRSKAKILLKNFKYTDLSDADVIFCYLLPETLAHLRTKLDKELKKGTKIISYSFQIKSWQEKDKIIQPNNDFCPIWVYEKN